MNDRRDSPRYKVNFPVTVQVPDGQDTTGSIEKIEGVVTTISDRGLTILTSGVPSHSGNIVFKFVLPGSQGDVCVQGKIAWTSKAAPSQRDQSEIIGCRFNSRIQNYPETVSLEPFPDRRGAQRKNGTKYSASSFLERVNKDGKALERWESYCTYYRVMRSGKIMLGSNNYLGLTTNPEVKQAAMDALEVYGTGSGGVPVLGGTTELHGKLASRLAGFKGTEDCVLFSSGFVANHTLFTTLLKEDDTVLLDEKSHASIIDGCRASCAKVFFYKHNDMTDLERKLARQERSAARLIATDSVFSMDGDISPLDKIYKLAKRYNASVMIDEAHATGVIGQTGHGLAEHFNLVGKIDFTVVTLSKALGAAGGAICCSKDTARFLKAHARSLMFSTSLPPSVCATAICAMDVIDSNPRLIEKLRENVAFMEGSLKKLGYNVIPTQSAIIPLVIGNEVKTYELVRLLDELGVFVNAVSRPAVSRKTSRLRVSVMATHAKEELERAVEAFGVAGKKSEII